ncbi:acyl carrier protein [Streptomyces sp. CB03238]|uniref:acyl carrier protein n=1 Tax=Streptomyces sp. CB03238 TaxID=1907777 RepID=UPI0015C45B6C|nr:acyl carrier protein [Streptomyces sp. CB03238]
MEKTEAVHVLARLESLLREVWDEPPAGEPVDRDASLFSLGVDSLTLVILLDRIESEFRVAWDPDNPPGAFSSLCSLAELVAAGSPDTAGNPDTAGKP